MDVLSDFANKFRYEVHACKADRLIITELYNEELTIQDKYKLTWQLKNLQLADIWVNHLNIMNIDYDIK